MEGLTGILAADRKQLILSCGYILQKVRGGKFLNILNNEWNQYREKGRIPDDYVGTEQNEECLQEILDYLDKDLIDDVTFDCLKKIFLVASTEKLTNRESYLPQQYMKICRRLSQGALIVLFTVYNFKKNEKNSQRFWREIILERSGFENELIELYETELYDKRLISNIGIPDNQRGYYRTTKFGHDLCSYIENYEE